MTQRTLWEDDGKRPGGVVVAGPSFSRRVADGPVLIGLACRMAEMEEFAYWWARDVARAVLKGQPDGQ